MIEKIVIEHARLRPFYAQPKGLGPMCLSLDGTDKPCELGCEYCRGFRKALEEMS